MDSINWGIIGLGNIAYRFAEAFNNVKNSKLLAISSKNQNNLKKFKTFFSIENKFCFENYNDLINCKDIDIVYIALPHSFHYQWVIECINSKKNILCEKPATINLLQMQRINHLLNNSNIFFAEGLMYRYHPQTIKLLQIINDNLIGNLISMSSYFGNNIIKKNFFFGITRTKINKKNRLFDKNLAGGSILDLGCYPVSMSTLIAELKSQTNHKKTEIINSKKDFDKLEVDVDSYALLKFDNNFIANIGCSFKKNIGQETIIIGSKGTIKVHKTWNCDPSVIIINDKIYEENQTKYKNIYAYEIESISNSLLNKSLKPDFPGVHRLETEKNMEIIEKWIN